MDSQEARLFQRHPREYNVEYSVLSGVGELSVVPARTLDFSESGARIQTGRELKKGDNLSVRFEVPDLNSFDNVPGKGAAYNRTVMMCFGEVRWVSRPEGDKLFSAGILFRHLSLIERTYLKRMLADELSGSTGPDEGEKVG